MMIDTPDVYDNG